MRKYGLIGYPLGHSFSRKYFSEKFKNERISGCQYENFPLTDIKQLPQLISDEPDLCGINVTIPYKSEVIRYLDSVEKEASAIGAVNVVKIRRSANNVFLSGFNSDITGIHDSIQPYIRSDMKHALVLGTGGSSRSVSFVLKSFGLKIIQVSRERREGVISYADISADIIADTRLIVNTTPLGMYPDTESKPDIDYSLLGKDHILFDLVYNPEITAFLKSGSVRGCKIVTGLKMLHSQAEKAWAIWNDDTL